ncbi:hypothetical protein K4L44_10565 [Halosquirtibacter laminarini]|uniref:Uncharacterized protein n=1 Tax=Halosquirtibacter laminarini TaxID=3374600 RepID=A0AC61NC03_9BACT|nr:hypothetical protein K4L44_10565 [Prolixibacteraceae bacterium]
MKKLTVILFVFLALCSCSKEEQDIPKIPSYVGGCYKLVRVDSPQIQDVNCNGVYEDLLTEYTTGNNPFNLNNSNNLLYCGRTEDSGGNEKFSFIFRVPGPYEMKEITNPFYDKIEYRKWDLTCSIYQPKVRPNDGTIGFTWDGLYSGSDHGSVRLAAYRNNMLIMKVVSVYYNQKEKVVEPITLTLIFKYLSSDKEEALKVSPATKFEEGDLSEEFIKQFN